MSDSVTRRLRSAVIPAALIALSAAACTAAAQDLRGAHAAPSASDRTTPGGDRSDALSRQLDQLTELLDAQQRQIEQQARQIEQMQQALDSQTMDSPALPGPLMPVQDMPTSASPASLSRSYGSVAAGAPCGDCGTCDPCTPGGACPSCGPCSTPDACPTCDVYGMCDPGAAGAADPGVWVDFGGQYRLIYDGANFDFHEPTIDDNQQSQNFFNQRFRTWVEMYTRSDVGVCFQVEMGHIIWGAAPEFPKTYPGPFSGPGDRVGIELRRGYLIYGDPATGLWRAGIQDWHDAFGESYTLGSLGAVDDYDSFGAVLANSVWDFNVAGLSYAGPAPLAPNLNFNAGMFMLWEGDNHHADDAYLLAFDLDRPFTDNHSIGFSVYYLVDQGQYSYPITLPGGGAFAYDSSWDLWLGIRGSTMLWVLPARAFAIFNTGQRDELGGLPRFHHDDVALKLELGPLPFGPGKLSFQTLYSTGDGNADETRRDGFRTIAQSARDNFGAQGYWSYLILTSPHGPSDVNDLGVSLQNRGLGLFVVQGKYEYPIFQRLSGTLALGWLRSDAPNPTSGSTDMGTELANMFALDLGGGLTLDAGAAVLFTGDFFRTAPGAPRPDELWEVFTRLQLEF